MITEPRSPAAVSQAGLVSQRLSEIGMSASQFARALGVAPAYISNMLRGTKRLTKDETIQRAAEVLGISSDRLYLAIDRVPPDVLAMTQKHPILLEAVRKLAAKLATAPPVRGQADGS